MDNDKDEAVDLSMEFVYDEALGFGGIDNGYFSLHVVGDSSMISNDFVTITRYHPHLPYSIVGPIVYGRQMTNRGYKVNVAPSSIQNSTNRTLLRICTKLINKLSDAGLLKLSRKFMR